MTNSPVIWFVRNKERVFGPFTPKQLKQLAANGKLTPEMEVRQGSDGKWVRARKLRGLFPAEETSAAALTESSGKQEIGGHQEVMEVEEVVEVEEVADAYDDPFASSDGVTGDVLADPFLSGTASDGDQPWVELSDVAFSGPVGTTAIAAVTPNEQPVQSSRDPKNVAQDYLDKAVTEVADYEIHKHKSNTIAGNFGTWIVDGLMAFGMALVINIMCCFTNYLLGIFTALPLAYMARKMFDIGDDGKAMAFCIATGVVLIANSVYVYLVTQLIVEHMNLIGK